MRKECVQWFGMASFISEEHYEDLKAHWPDAQQTAFSSVIDGLVKTFKAAERSALVDHAGEDHGDPPIGNLVKKQVEKRYHKWVVVFVQKYTHVLRFAPSPIVVQDSMMLSPLAPPSGAGSMAASSPNTVSPGNKKSTRQFKSPNKLSPIPPGSPFQRMSVIGDTIVEDDDGEKESFSSMTGDLDTHSLNVIMTSIEATSKTVFAGCEINNDNRNDTYYETAFGGYSDKVSLLCRSSDFVKRKLKEENDRIGKDLIIAKQKLIDLQRVSVSFKKAFFSRVIRQSMSTFMAQTSVRRMDSHFHAVVMRYAQLDSTISAYEIESEMSMIGQLKLMSRLSLAGRASRDYREGDIVKISMDIAMAPDRNSGLTIVNKDHDSMDAALFDWVPYLRHTNPLDSLNLAGTVSSSRIDGTLDIELRGFLGDDGSFTQDAETALFPLLLLSVNIDLVEGITDYAINGSDKTTPWLTPNLRNVNKNDLFEGMEVVVGSNLVTGFIRTIITPTTSCRERAHTTAQTELLVTVDFKSGSNATNVPLSLIFHPPRLQLSSVSTKGSITHDKNDSKAIMNLDWDYRVGESVLMRQLFASVWQKGYIVRQRNVKSSISDAALKCYDVLLEDASISSGNIRRGVLNGCLRPFIQRKASSGAAVNDATIPNPATETKLRVQRDINLAIEAETLSLQTPERSPSKATSPQNPYKSALRSMMSATAPVRYKHPLADWPEMSKTRTFRRKKPSALWKARLLDRQLNTTKEVTSDILEGKCVQLTAAEQRELADIDMHSAAEEFENSDIGQQLLMLKGAIIQDKLKSVQSQTLFKAASGDRVRAILLAEGTKDDDIVALLKYNETRAVVIIQSAVRRCLAINFVREVRDIFIEQQYWRHLLQQCQHETQSLMYKYASLTSISNDFITAYISHPGPVGDPERNAQHARHALLSTPSLSSLGSAFLKVIADFCIAITTSPRSELDGRDLRFLSDLISHMTGVAADILDVDKVHSMRESIGYCDRILHFFDVSLFPSLMTNHEVFLKKIADIRAGTFAQQALIIQCAARVFLAKRKYRNRYQVMCFHKCVCIQKVFRGFSVRAVLKKKKNKTARLRLQLAHTICFEVISEAMCIALKKVGTIARVASIEVSLPSVQCTEQTEHECACIEGIRSNFDTNECLNILDRDEGIVYHSEGNSIQKLASDLANNAIKSVLSTYNVTLPFRFLLSKPLPPLDFCILFLNSLLSSFAHDIEFTIQKIASLRCIHKSVRAVVYETYDTLRAAENGTDTAAYATQASVRASLIQTISDSIAVIADFNKTANNCGVPSLISSVEALLDSLPIEFGVSPKIIAAFVHRNLSHTLTDISARLEKDPFCFPWYSCQIEVSSCILKALSKVSHLVQESGGNIMDVWATSDPVTVEKMMLAVCQQVGVIIASCAEDECLSVKTEGIKPDVSDRDDEDDDLCVFIDMCSRDAFQMAVASADNCSASDAGDVFADLKGAEITSLLCESIVNYLSVFL